MIHITPFMAFDALVAAGEKIAVIIAVKEMIKEMASRQSGAWTISGLPESGTAPTAPRRSPGVQAMVQRMLPGGATGYQDPVQKLPGILPAIQRLIPGGQTGMTIPGAVPVAGIEGAAQRAIPGGQTGYQWQDFTPGTHGRVVKVWFANQTPFALNEDGTISVQKKNGTIKTYRPYKATVFGKNPDAKKFLKVAKKHQAMYKELHKVFKHKTVRK